MKLRIKGDSLRLRVTPMEMVRLLDTGSIEETTHFGPQDDERLVYALEHGDVPTISVRHELWRISVVLPTTAVRVWASGEDVGVYGSLALAAGRLEIAIEKDWACLDNHRSASSDAFPNPKKS